MQHESFYTTGFYSDQELGVYAGWIALQGCFLASQPFSNETGDIVLLFSGECFIDPEEGRKLISGRPRRATGCAEWLVHAYEERGDQLFEKLNGLFSGFLIDKRLGKVFLFNDRYGVQRIYWHEADGEFFFASEAKALLRIFPQLREFDTEGVADFLAFGCTLGTRTLFHGINLLPSASVWSFEDGNCQRRTYFSPTTWEAQSRLSPERFQSEFENTFKRVLPRYFESESRIGISLTAGLDSRMIMACLPELEKQPACYTFSGQGRETLDASLARRVAKVCNLDHEIVRMGSDFFPDFAAHVDRTVYITDGCLGPLGAHEIYLNAKLRLLALVRLTGVFGGEILRNMSMFQPLGLVPELINKDLRAAIRSSVVQQEARRGEHPVTFTAFREIAEKRYGTPAASRSQVTFRTPYLDNEIVALAYRAPERIRSSTLSDWHLIEANNARLSKIPTDMGAMGGSHKVTTLLRRLFFRSLFKLDYLYTEGLPHLLSPLDPLLAAAGSALGVVGLHKFLNYRVWFRGELAGYLNESMRDAQVRGNWAWDTRFVKRLAPEHIRRRKNYIHEINAVATLEAIERLLLRDLPRDVTVSQARESIAVTSIPQGAP